MRREAAPIADLHVPDIAAWVLQLRPEQGMRRLPERMLMALDSSDVGAEYKVSLENLVKAGARVAVRSFPATARREMCPPVPPHAKAEAAGPVELPGIHHGRKSSHRP
jgi:hypothetical protein